MDINKKRQQMLNELIRLRGSQSAFCEAVEMSQGQVSQLCTGSRNIGEKVARKIEKRLGLDAGYMDGESIHPKAKAVESINIDVLTKHLISAIEYSRQSNKEIPVKSLVVAALAAYDHEMSGDENLINTILMASEQG